jgi:phage regulator Rha-like protein
MVVSGKWSCDRCKWDRLRQLEEKLENALQQIEELKRKNKGLEEQLRGWEAGYGAEATRRCRVLSVGRLDYTERGI